jgi:general secretion pathway protein G
MVTVRMRRGRATPGFTLIELMIVMTLIIILAGIGVMTYTNGVTRAKEAVLKEDLFRMRDALDQFYADKNEYPASLQLLVEEGYLRELPVDPITNSADTWVTELASPGLGDPLARPGIFNVRSGAETTAIDGTAYAEW